MTTPTTTNYTKAQTTELVSGYKACKDAESRDAYLAEMVKVSGRKLGSLRSKLVSEKVYVKKTVVSSVTGETATKKFTMAENLVALAGVNTTSEGKTLSPNSESIEKMNKTDIQFFLTKIADLQNTIFALENERDGVEMSEVEPAE